MEDRRRHARVAIVLGVWNVVAAVTMLLLFALTDGPLQFLMYLPPLLASVLSAIRWGRLARFPLNSVQLWLGALLFTILQFGVLIGLMMLLESGFLSMDQSIQSFLYFFWITIAPVFLMNRIGLSVGLALTKSDREAVAES